MLLYIKKTFKKHDHADICSTGAKYKFWKIAYSLSQSKMRATLRHIQNNGKHIRWSVLGKYLKVLNHQLFSQNVPS